MDRDWRQIRCFAACAHWDQVRLARKGSILPIAGRAEVNNRGDKPKPVGGRNRDCKIEYVTFLLHPTDSTKGEQALGSVVPGSPMKIDA